MAMAQERSNSEYVSITGVRRQMLQASLSESEQRSRVLHDALGQLSSARRESQSSESTSSEGGVLANVTHAEAPALIRALVEAGIEIDEARWVGADLESVFMTETGHQETPHAG